MSRGERRLRSSHRVARSTSLRPSRNILVCVPAWTRLSRASISAHRVRISKIHVPPCRPGRSRPRSPRSPLHAEGKGGTAAVHHLLLTLGRDDLAGRVRAHLLRKRSRRGVGKYRTSSPARYGSSGTSSRVALFERDLGVRQQPRRARERSARGRLAPALAERLVVGEELQLAVEAAGLLEGAHDTRACTSTIRRPGPWRGRDRLGLR